jgi:hypothetical protein
VNSRRKCGGCGEYFRPDRTFPGPVAWCSPDCGLTVARKRVPAVKASQERQERKEHKEAKQRIKTRSEWLKEAQAAFNAYIRERDKDQSCICCGMWPEVSNKPGGDWDAGHFLSRGAYPELRFVETNCHKQLKSCNAGSSKYARKGRTVAANYRERLIDKIGLAEVEWLEGPHEAKKYTIDDLRTIRDEYKLKLKQMRESE